MHKKLKFIHILSSTDINGSGVAYVAINQAKFLSKYTENLVYCINGISKTQSNSHFVDFIDFYQLLRIIISNNSNNYILHFHGFWSPRFLPIIFLCILFNAEYSISPHVSLEPEALQISYFKKKIYLKILMNKFILNCLFLVAYSEKEAVNLSNFCPAVKVVSSKIGIDLFPQVKFESHIFPSNINLDKRKIILCISRIHKAKGLDLLLKAWSSLPHLHKSWQIVIAGPDDGFLFEIQRFCDQNNLHSSVTLLDKVNYYEKDILFKLSSIFILPSLSENFGIVVAEAMSYKIPVITTMYTPWCNLVRETGCFCIYPEPSIIRECLSNLISLNKAEISSRTSLAYEYIQSNHSWTQITLKLLRDIDNLLLMRE